MRADSSILFAIFPDLYARPITFQKNWLGALVARDSILWLRIFGSVFSLFAISLSVFLAEDAFGGDSVTWEQQAERLQNVSASLLDNVPASVVPRGGFNVGLGTVVSFLPDLNSRVGGKSEKVPASPIHAVPQLQLSYGLDLELTRVTTRAWVGYLPSGAEGLFGVDAKMTQWSAGVAVASGVALGLPPFIGGAAVELGYQISVADVKGAITEPDANDTFDSTSQIMFASIGLHPDSMGLHAAFLVAGKSTRSKFVVSSTRTALELTDRLEDSSVPVLLQAQLGFRFPFDVTLGLAELWVPDRLLMPRLFAQYEHSL